MDPQPELSLSGRRHHTPSSLRTPENIRREIEKVQRQIDKLEMPADKSTVPVSDDDNTVPKNVTVRAVRTNAGYKFSIQWQTKPLVCSIRTIEADT